MSKVIDVVRGIQFSYGLGVNTKGIDIIIPEKEIVGNHEIYAYLDKMVWELYGDNLYNGMISLVDMLRKYGYSNEVFKNYLFVGLGTILEQEGYMKYDGIKSNEWSFALEKYLSEYIFKNKKYQKMFLMYVAILEEGIRDGFFDEEMFSRMIKSFSCTEYSELAKPYAKRVIRLLYGLGL